MVDEAAEPVAALNPAGGEAWRRVRWFEGEAAVGALGVVVVELLGHDAVEMSVAADDDPVEALTSDRPDEPLRVGVRDGRSDWGEDYPSSSSRCTSTTDQHPPTVSPNSKRSRNGLPDGRRPSTAGTTT